MAGNAMLEEFTLTPEGDDQTRLRVVESGHELCAWPDAEKERSYAEEHREGRSSSWTAWPCWSRRPAVMTAGITERPDEELWSAIADPSGRQVLDLRVGHGAVSASWLAGRVPFTRQAGCKHQVVIERAGRISRRKQGRDVRYQVEAERHDQAARAMAELAARWDQRLGAITRLAEAAHAENKKNPDEP